MNHPLHNLGKVILAAAILALVPLAGAGKEAVKTKLLAAAVAIASKYPGMDVRHMDTDVLRQGGVGIYKGV
jgi:hypothetical protein